MLESFTAGDSVLHGEAFVRDEVAYNLIHRIVEIDGSIKIKARDGTLILAQSEGHNPWLWISREVDAARKETLIQELVEHLKDAAFPGISAEPDTARLFARTFCQMQGTLFHTYMILEAYHCPEVKKPALVSGHAVQATGEDTATVAEFMAGFTEDAYGVPANPESLLQLAEEEARSGRVYLWVVDGAPVSMAKIARRTARHARINDVYTPRAHRKKGYGSAVVAEVCAQIMNEQLTPLLYADAKNPDSNKVYQTIGFVQVGRIADIKFD